MVDGDTTRPILEPYDLERRVEDTKKVDANAIVMPPRLAGGVSRSTAYLLFVIGLMIGVEFVDPATRAPVKELADQIMEMAFRNGLLVLTCGASTIRFCPPLVLTREQADEAVELFELSIRDCI